jgi:hypothetical protein
MKVPYRHVEREQKHEQKEYEKEHKHERRSRLATFS